MTALGNLRKLANTDAVILLQLRNANLQSALPERENVIKISMFARMVFGKLMIIARTAATHQH